MPRRYRLGIRLRTLWGLAALLSVFLAGSAMLLADSWTKLRTAAQAETRNHIAGELVLAALNLGAERGMTNGTLNSALPPSQRVVDRIAHQREASAARLQTALQGLTHNPYALNTDTTADLVVAARTLDDLRAQVDAEVQLSSGDRDRLFATEWRPAISDVIELLRAAIYELASPAIAPDTELQTVLEFRMAAFDLRNAAGERAALTAGVLGAERPISRSEAVLIGSRREAAELTWKRLRRLSEAIADSRVDEAMAEAESGYFASYGGLLDRITAAGLEGTAYPVALPTFFLETEAVLKSLDRLMSTVQLLSAEMSAQRVAAAQARLYLILVAIAAGLLVVLVPAFAFSRRVLRPIEETTDAMRRLAAGRVIDADLPVTQPDEIGEMSRAIAAFRDSMLASQTALSAAETFTRRTIDALPSLVAVLDENGIIIAANKSWRERAAAVAGSGVATEGQSYLRACDESAASGDECAAAIASGLRAVIAGTRTEFESEYPSESPAGPTWYRMRVSCFGEPGAACIIVIHDDITGRKRAEEGVQERNRLLELAERMSSTGHWRLDLNGGVLRWSSEIYRIFGQPPADFTPDVKSTLAACVPEDRYSLVAAALEALRSGAGFSRDLRMFRSDGQFLSVEIMAGCERNVEGRVTALFGVLRDVSERKKAEEHLADVNIELERRVAVQTAALSAREAHLRGILDTVAEMVMTISEDYRIESFTPAAERAFGYAASEVIGRPADLLARRDVEGVTETGISGYLRPGLVDAGDGASREIMALRKDGTSMPAELTVAGMRIAGRIVYIAAMRDITKHKRNQRALQERAALLHRTQYLAGIGHWSWSRDRQSGGWHTGLEYSRSIADLYGVDPEELVVPDEIYVARFVHAEDREMVAAAFGDFKLRTRERGPLEYRIVRPDGAIRHVREVTENVPENADDPAEVLGTIQDITVRKRAELALRDSEARLRAIFDHAPVTISLRDVDARYVMVNRRFRELFGLPESEIIGRTPEQFYPPSYGDAISRAIDQVRLTRDIVITEEVAMTVEGEVRALTTRFPVTDDLGRLSGIGSISVDLTGQRAAEAALRASESRLRTIFESEPECVALLGADGALLEINPAGLAMIEAAAADIPGRCLDTLVEPEYRDAFRKLIAGVFDGDSGSLLFELTGLAGGRRWMEMNAVPLRGPDGVIASALSIARDVTAQHDMEERLRQAQKMEAVGQLTGGIAHDFNNLLGVIVGNLDLLSVKLATESTERELVERAIAAAERGGALTHRLLAFARRQTLMPQQVESAKLVTEVAQLLRRTIEERIELVVKIEPALPPCYVDPGQLETALLNLAINARDAMPEGGTLTIAAASVTVGEQRSGPAGGAPAAGGVTPGDYVVISVTDTGEGMDEEVRERAFEPFFTTKGVGKGSGLGLSMVYGFAQQSDGHVKLDSAPGHGTTVSLFLKTCGPPPAPAAAAVQRPAQGRGQLILVVEDDDEMRAFAIGALKRLGYRTAEAADGAAALAMLHDHGDIAALFTDVMLPGALNGFAIAGKIRARHPEMPVLYTSGFADFDRLPPELLAGEVELLAKPYRVSDLGLRLERLLKRRRPRGT